MPDFHGQQKVEKLYVAAEYPDTIAAVSNIDCLSSEVLAVYQGKEVPLMVYRNISAKEAILKYMRTYDISPLNYRINYDVGDEYPFDEGFIANGVFVSSEESPFSIDAVSKERFIVTEQTAYEVVCECTRAEAKKIALVLARLNNHGLTA